MKTFHTWKTFAVLTAMVAIALPGCAPTAAQKPVSAQETAAKAEADRKQRFQARPPINTSRNLYEGGLWRGAASWGNLMRDHRARYRGDLLTVREMARIIKIPDPVPEPTAAQVAAQQGAQAQAQAQGQEGQPQQREDPILAYLRNLEKRRLQVEREQNDILRAIESIEVEVYRVLPNGNLMVRGNHPPIFRDRNRVKYIVSLRGMVRPSDVDDNNSIMSSKLSKAEYKIRRLVRRSSAVAAEISSVARAAGANKEAEFVDRVSGAAANAGQ